MTTIMTPTPTPTPTPITAAAGLEPVTAHLLAGDPLELGFAPGMVVRSFLLRGADGNVLVNASDGILRNGEAVEAAGGATALWLGHWHEAMLGAGAIAKRFGTPVHVHQADHEEAAKRVAVAGTFDGPKQIAPDLRAIPIPGHTPGSTAYLWRGPEARCLFTADSLYVSEGELRGVLLGDSDRGTFLDSLRRLREVEFDLLVPWVARAGAPIATPFTRDGFARSIDAVIGRVTAGADG
ncbi:MBL fold metallo-hydrolase [Amaricoccus sp. W119]|uniref:MBL fold metallo-hydrolase n=1 Tax=Amaricoccus sp. W119 TaxID=3391833 RepID=UPI0039A50755